LWAGVGAGVLLALLGWLHTPPGLTWAVNTALRVFNPFVGATLQVARVEGMPYTHLVAHAVNLVRDDGRTVLHLDTLVARYDLRRLWDRTLYLDELTATRPVLALSQKPDHSWDVLDLLPPTDTTAIDTSTAWRVVINHARLTGGAATLRFYPPERDSTLHLHALDAALHDLRLGPAPALVLDSARATLQGPGRAGPFAARLAATLAGTRLTIPALSLTSTHSTVRAEGAFHLPDDTTGFHDLHLRLHATPLHTRDLVPFFALPDTAEALMLEAMLTGDARLVALDGSARLRDGTTLFVTGEATPPQAGLVIARLEAHLRDLPLARLTGNPADTAPVRLDLSADLHGAMLDRLNGTATATLYPLRYGGYALETTTATAILTEGLARLRARSRVQGASLRAEATLRPFDEVPDWTLQAQVQDVDLGRFLHDPSQTSALGGTLTASGKGFDLQRDRMQATVRLAPSPLNRYRIDAGTLNAQLVAGRLAFDTEVRLPEGRLAFTGHARLDDLTRYEITEGVLDRLDLAALAGDTTRSRVSGAFTLRGSGFDPATMHLAGRATLHESHYGPYPLNRGDLVFTLARGRLDLTTEARLPAGDVAFEADLRPFDPVPRFTLRQGRFAGLDLGTLLHNPEQQSRLNGRFTLAGRGFDPATLSLEGRIDLDESTLNAQCVEAATLDFSGQRGRFDYTLYATLPEGQTRLTGTLHPFADPLVYTVETGTLEGLNLGALTGLPDLDTRLHGTVAFRGTGTDPRTATFTARLDLARAQVNRETVEEGFVEVHLDNGLARLDTDLSFGLGHARLTAEGRLLDAVPTYTAEGTLEQVDLARLIGRDTLTARVSATFAVSGEAFDPRTMTLQGRLVSPMVRYDQVQATNTHLAFRLTQGLLHVDTLQVASNVAALEGGGTLAVFDTTHVSDFRFQADVRNTEPLRRLLAARRLGLAEGLIRGRAYGPGNQLRFEADVLAKSLAWEDVRVAGAEVWVEGALTPERTLADARLTTRLDFFSLPDFRVERTRLDARYVPDRLDFSGSVKVDARRDAHLAGHFDLRPDQRVLTLQEATLRLDEDQWTLLQEATLSTLDDAYRVRNFLLYTGDQQVALDGVVDLAGEQNLVLSLENFRIGAVADLLRYEGLDGTLNGFLNLSGPATAPAFTGALDLDLEADRREVGDLHLDLDYTDRQMGIESRVTHVTGGVLALNGTLPLDLTLRPPPEDEEDETRVVQARQADPQSSVDLTLVADTFQIGWIQPFLDPTLFSRFDGQLTARLRIGGTLEDPQLNGSARLHQGQIGLPLFGLLLKDGQADMALDSNRIQFRQFSTRSGRGLLTGEGSITLRQLTLGDFDLRLHPRTFLASDSDVYRAVVDGDLTLGGTTLQPILIGTVQVLEGDFFLTEEIIYDPIPLQARDEQLLEQRFGLRLTASDTTTFDFYEALRMDLQVELRRDTWLRSRTAPQMDIQFTGNLDVQKQPYGEEMAFGTIEIVTERSRVLYFGKRFNLTRGTITLNGLLTDPVMDFEAQYVVPTAERQEEFIVKLIARGRFEDSNWLTLSSEPLAELPDILSYLAFGRPANQAFQFGGTTSALVDPATGLLASQINSFFENLFGTGSNFDLDVIEIRPTSGLQGATLTLGKYFSFFVDEQYVSFYAAYSFPITLSNSSFETLNNNDTELTLEYELIRHLLVTLQRRGATLSLNLRWNYAY
jgi:translocation and assembly module TamB